MTEIKGAVDLNNNPFLRVCDGLPKEEGEMCDVWFFTKDDELIELDT